MLDVGCRNCEAQTVVPRGVEYFGNDLFQNAVGSVTYVGDALTVEFGRTFDCVMALDVVEHVDNPHGLMDKLVSLAERYLLISLPNIYDLKHKYDFVINNSLGGKYLFGTENRTDRHRWVMNYDEIQQFYSHYANRHGMSLVTRDVVDGLFSPKLTTRLAYRSLSLLLSKRTLTRTVFGFFSKVGRG
jgi:hypothetical protein